MPGIESRGGSAYPPAMCDIRNIAPKAGAYEMRPYAIDLRRSFVALRGISKVRGSSRQRSSRTRRAQAMASQSHAPSCSSWSSCPSCKNNDVYMPRVALFRGCVRRKDGDRIAPASRTNTRTALAPGMEKHYKRAEAEH